MINYLRVKRTIATLGPVGFLPAPGTCATALTLVFVGLLSYLPALVYGIVTALVCWGAYYSIRDSLPSFGGEHDPQVIVIDEVAGTLITFLFLPLNGFTVLLGFVLFRVIDIFKPFGISEIEQGDDAWRILADDVVAGVLSRIVILLVMWCNGL